MTDAEIRTLNAELGFNEASADRWIHDSRADKRREKPEKRMQLADWRQWLSNTQFRPARIR